VGATERKTTDRGHRKPFPAFPLSVRLAVPEEVLIWIGTRSGEAPEDEGLLGFTVLVAMRRRAAQPC
jgi:hypothetical protein